jgi:ankyrin repeat protein
MFFLEICLEILSQTNGNGSTILHFLCNYIAMTPISILDFLINVKNADISIQDNDGNTPYHLAFSNFEPNSIDQIVLISAAPYVDYLLEMAHQKKKKKRASL